MSTKIESKSRGARQAPAASRLSVPVEGMTCASCVAHVEKAISKIPGVTDVSVNLATERAEVSFAGDLDPAAVVRAVEGAGYGVPETELELGVEGMTCASCVGACREGARQGGRRQRRDSQPRHREGERSLPERRCLTRGDRGGDPRCGLRAAPHRERRRRRRPRAGGTRARDERRFSRALLTAALLTLPVFVLEMGSHLIPAMHEFVMDTIGMQHELVHPVRADDGRAVRTGLALLPEGRARDPAAVPRT